MRAPTFLLAETRPTSRFERYFAHISDSFNDEDDEVEHWEEDEEDWDD